MAEFTSVFGARLGVRGLVGGDLIGLWVGTKASEVVLHQETAHAIIRTLIELAGEPPEVPYFPKVGMVIKSTAGVHYTRIGEDAWISEFGTRFTDEKMFYQDHPEKYFTLVAGG